MRTRSSSKAAFWAVSSAKPQPGPGPADNRVACRLVHANTCARHTEKSRGLRRDTLNSAPAAIGPADVESRILSVSSLQGTLPWCVDLRVARSPLLPHALSRGQ